MQQRKTRRPAKPATRPDDDVVQSDLVFTGERIVPEADNCEPNFASRMYHEHIARYLFAGQIVANKSVIDIGCGVGYGSQRLAQLGAASVHAFDLSEDAVRHARAHYGHPNVRFEVGNAEQFEMDHRFDVAICFELIEHVPNPRKVLQNIKAVLKDDGILVMSTPRALEEKRTHFHEHEFDLEEYASLIGDYFEKLDMYVENNHFSSLVTKEPPSVVDRILCLKDQFTPESADVFIAVAGRSKAALPKMSPALALDSDAYVSMLERDVAILHKAEDDLRALMAAADSDHTGIIAFKDAEIERLIREHKSLFERSEVLSTKLWEAEQRSAQLAAKEAEIERLVGEYKTLFDRSEALSTKLWEAEQRGAQLAEKESDIQRLTSESSRLRDRCDNLTIRLQDLEMKHAEIEQERSDLMQQLQRETVRAGDAEERRSKAYEFARISGEEAYGLRRELQTLKRDIENALERPGHLKTAEVDQTHRGIVEAMERLFVGTEATHYMARDPLVDRVNELALRTNHLLSEIQALQDYQRHAEDWHAQILRVRKSFSWRITAPLRGLARPFRRPK